MALLLVAGMSLSPSRINVLYPNTKVHAPISSSLSSSHRKLFLSPHISVCPLPVTNSVRVSAKLDAPSVEGPKGCLELDLKVREYELDNYGVVNNAVYANYCQHGGHELLEAVGIKEDAVLSLGALATIELFLKFRAPLKRGDRFKLIVKFSGSSAARIYIAHTILKQPNLEVILEAKSTVACLDKNYRPVRLPGEIKSKIVQFLHYRGSM